MPLDDLTRIYTTLSAHKEEIGDLKKITKEVHQKMVGTMDEPGMVFQMNAIFKQYKEDEKMKAPLIKRFEDTEAAVKNIVEEKKRDKMTMHDWATWGFRLLLSGAIGVAYYHIQSKIGGC